MSIAINLGSLNLALSLAGATTASSFPQANSISTTNQINDLRGITRQAEKERAASIARPILPLVGFEYLCYPKDLRKFYMRIDFKQYKRPNPTLPAELPTIHSIYLPIPTALTDAFGLDYQPYDAGLAGMLSTSFNENQGFSAAPGVSVAKQFVERFGGQIGSSLMNIAAQNLQASFNPLKSVVFNTPNLKTYGFNWTFAPNSKEESEELRKIIKKMKSSILPTYAKSVDPNKLDYNVFNYPYMAKIQLFPWAADQSGEAEMFQTKHGFIDSFAVNYSPENNISFFDGEKNAPTFVEFSFSFIEIEMHTAEDYGRTGSLVDANQIEQQATDLQNKIGNDPNNPNAVNPGITPRAPTTNSNSTAINDGIIGTD